MNEQNQNLLKTYKWLSSFALLYLPNPSMFSFFPKCYFYPLHICFCDIKRIKMPAMSKNTMQTQLNILIYLLEAYSGLKQKLLLLSISHFVSYLRYDTAAGVTIPEYFKLN